MPEITVKIMRDVPTDMPDGTVEYSDAVMIQAPSERAATGQKYVAFCVDSLKHLVQPDDRGKYVRNSAYALASFECPDSRDVRLRRHLEAEYADEIDLKLSEVLEGVA